MRLIDADELLKEVENAKDLLTSTKDSIRIHVHSAPTIDPVKHGRWLSTDTNICECSVCHTCEPYMFREFDWCPNCGAKMGGGEVDIENE